MTQDDSINARQIKKFNSVAKKNGISSKSVLWDDPQTQYFRFYELIKLLDLNSSRMSLLDIGCGNGELYKFLNLLGYRGKYVGYDINEILLSQAKSRFRNIEFKNVNIISDEISQQFNYVVMSGLFNLNVGQSSEWIKTFLKKMYALSNEVMVFNMISTHVTYRNEGMFYMNPAEILSFCIDNLSKRTTLMHHNLPYNYTVVVYKDELWNSVNEGASK